MHTGRRDIVELARTSAARLIAGGIVVRLLEDEAPALDIPDAEVVPADADAARDAEIVMVFGGDGTFLRAAELARYTDAALMGVNLGRVGFLAETEPEAVEETLHRDRALRVLGRGAAGPRGRRPRRRRHASSAAPGRSTRCRSRRPSAPACSTSSSPSTAAR